MKDKSKDYIMKTLKDLISSSGHFKTIQYNKHKQYYDSLLHTPCNSTKNEFTPQQRLYLMLNGEQDMYCENEGCDNIKRFSFKSGFTGRFCSNSCANQGRVKLTPEQEVKRLEKIKKTKLERYGSETYNNSDKQKETLGSNLETKLLLSLKRKEIMASRSHQEVQDFVSKTKRSKLERYGSETYNNSKKQSNTIRSIYGVENSAHIHILNYDNYNKEYIRKNFISDGWFLRYEFETYFGVTWQASERVKNEYEINEPNKTKFHKTQTEIYNFIKEYYEGEVLFNHRIKDGDNLIEFDIYLPELNFAIEYDGLMFHSHGTSEYSMFNNPEENPRYHLSKTEFAESMNVHLFHIFENEWLDKTKKEIWKSMIKNKLKVNKRIFARKCEVREISTKISRDFLNENHLQGTVGASVKMGLYYGEELVQVATLGMPRFNKKFDFELLRFCTKRDMNIVGGFSKLIKNSLPKGKSLVSYGNRRFSSTLSNTYLKNGFVSLGYTTPNFWYFLPKEYRLYHRASFQKHLIVTNETKHLTGTEIMYRKGYRKIFDCGSSIFCIKGNVLNI